MILSLVGFLTVPPTEEESIEELTMSDLRHLVTEMKATLKAREVQLERKFEEVANMQEVTHKLMVQKDFHSIEQADRNLILQNITNYLRITLKWSS